jgi:CDP-6-deoxy-D-xylo-4-hexulose-3-dehydrase
MKRLPLTVEARNRNFKVFVENLDLQKYHTDFETDGVSLFAFPVIAKGVSLKRVSKVLDSFGVEYRPLIAGNLMRHPMMNSINTFRKFKNADFIHDNSYYVGNNEWVTEEQVKELTKVLNEA